MHANYVTKALVPAVMLAALPLCAAAQSRPQTPAMSCTAAQGLVRAHGAIVLGTGRDLFDRYVRDQQFCGPGEATIATFVPSGDNPQCFVGYRCVPVSMDKP